MPVGEPGDFFAGIEADVPEALAQHLRQVAVIDHHVHGYFDRPVDRATFESSINEASTDPVPAFMSQFDSPLGLSIRRWCAPMLGLDPLADADSYWARRTELTPDELAAAMLPAAGVSHWIVDTGFKGDLITPHGRLAEIGGGRAVEIVRLERLAEDLLSGGIAAEDYPDAFRAALARAASTPDVVGTKTIAAYRTGFDIDWTAPSDADVVAHVRASVEQPGPLRLDDPVLIVFGVHQAAALVAQTHGQAVKLGLGHVFDGGVGVGQPQFAPHAGVKRLRARGFSVGFGVDAEHGHHMAHRGQPFHHSANHALRGRIRGDEVRVRRFQRLQLLEQRVVRGIGQLGVVQHVVAVGMVVQQAVQFGGALGGIVRLRRGEQVGLSHHENSRLARGEPADRSRASSVSYNCSRSAPITSSASTRMTWPLSSVMVPSMDAASVIADSRMRTNGRSLRSTCGTSTSAASRTMNPRDVLISQALRFIRSKSAVSMRPSRPPMAWKKNSDGLSPLRYELNTKPLLSGP